MAMPRRWYVYLLLAVAALGLIAFTSSAPAPKRGRVTVTPSDLFPGDLKRLEPHLVSASGCVRLRYDGPKKYLQLAVYLWQDGQWQFSTATTAPIKVPLDTEVSASLHYVGNLSDDLAYSGVVAHRPAAGGGGAARFHLERVKHAGSRVLNLRAPVEASDDRPVVLWGYAMYSSNSLPGTTGDIRKDAEKCSHAAVLVAQLLDKAAPPATTQLAPR